MDADFPQFHEDAGALSCPWVESPFFGQLLARASLSAADKELASRFARDGYVVLEGAIEAERIDAVLAEYPRLFDPENDFPEAPQELRPLLRRDPGRKEHAWVISEAVRGLACQPEILRVLRMLYGREPIPFQTLNFLWGTEQSLHSDAMHFSSIPARFMCGVWVALEDVSLENGPLRYLPGSHRFRELRLEELGVWAEDDGERLGASYARYERYVEALAALHSGSVQELVVKKGGALVWAANLLHGGSPILRKGSTRKSQVTHYYFEDCVYYSPILSNAALGEIHLRRIHDIRRRREVPHVLNGEELIAEPIDAARHRLRRPGSPDSPAPSWLHKLPWLRQRGRAHP